MNEVPFRRPAQKALADLDRQHELSEMAEHFVSDLDRYLSHLASVPDRPVDLRRAKFGLIVNQSRIGTDE